MGMRQQLTGGHLCIDLTNIEMSTDDQQALLVCRSADGRRSPGAAFRAGQGGDDQPGAERTGRSACQGLAAAVA
jgi:hypothetical protein